MGSVIFGVAAYQMERFRVLISPTSVDGNEVTIIGEALNVSWETDILFYPLNGQFVTTICILNSLSSLDYYN